MAAADLWWVEEGAEVEVEWGPGDWWPAIASEIFDYADARTVLIVYGRGWKKYNEWVGDASRVRPCIGAVNLELEDFNRAFGTTEGAIVDGDGLPVLLTLTSPPIHTSSYSQSMVTASKFYLRDWNWRRIEQLIEGPPLFGLNST